MKLVFEIAVAKQTRTRDQTFEGVQYSGVTLPFGAPLLIFCRRGSRGGRYATGPVPEQPAGARDAATPIFDQLLAGKNSEFGRQIF